MRPPSEIEEKLSQINKSLADGVEYRDMARLNNGWDLDRERVLGGLITVENEKRKLLEWVLEREKVGDK